VSHGKDYDLRKEILVHDAEGKLPEGVFSEIGWRRLASVVELA
jgi:hypothetical protein